MLTLANKTWCNSNQSTEKLIHDLVLVLDRNDLRNSINRLVLAHLKQHTFRQTYFFLCISFIFDTTVKLVGLVFLSHLI